MRGKIFSDFSCLQANPQATLTEEGQPFTGKSSHPMQRSARGEITQLPGVEIVKTIPLRRGGNVLFSGPAMGLFRRMME
jgi:hypothetical protein